MPRRLVNLVTLFLLVGCGSTVQNSGDQTGTVTGLVEFRACGGPPVDSPTPCIFHPIAGATVELEVGGHTVKSAVTDGDGRYSVSATPGTYTMHIVVVKSAAVTDDSRTVKVGPGQRVVADFQLTFQAL